ncbi:MAG: hypothetical protein HUU48_11340 [Flavobacteriales bacterium]|nr:hypothetical protein [Flavobacteriales bacterium]
MNMKWFMLSFGIVIFFTTCKKDKTFGEKYPELVGEWEWVGGYTIVECGGIKYGTSPGGATLFCPSYFFPGESYYNITNHHIIIKNNGVFVICNNGRLLEKGYFKSAENPQLYFDNKNNIIEKEYYIEERRNILSKFFLYNRESILGIDYLKRNISITHKYYANENKEEMIIQCEKAGRGVPDSTILNLIYNKK